MSKKNILTLAGALLLVAIAAAAAWFVRLPAGMQREPLPAIVGALVRTNDDRSSITVASADGSEKTFVASYKTPVVSLVRPGEVARTLGELRIGDVLAVIVSSGNASSAQKIRLVPPSEPAAEQPATTIIGTLISQSASSITMEPEGEAAIIAPGTPMAIMLNSSTVVLAEALGGQTGRLLADAGPGTKVRIAASVGEPLTALVVELLLSN